MTLQSARCATNCFCPSKIWAELPRTRPVMALRKCPKGALIFRPHQPMPRAANLSKSPAEVGIALPPELVFMPTLVTGAGIEFPRATHSEVLHVMVVRGKQAAVSPAQEPSSRRPPLQAKKNWPWQLRRRRFFFFFPFSQPVTWRERPTNAALSIALWQQ